MNDVGIHLTIVDFARMTDAELQAIVAATDEAELWSLIATILDRLRSANFERR